MDPALQEQLLPDLSPDDILEVLIRLHKPGVFPPKITVVSQFGEVITCRIRRRDVLEVYRHASVRSMKAARVLGIKGWKGEQIDTIESMPTEPEGFDPEPVSDEAPAQATGRGVVIAMLDWTCDFAHHDFLHPDGKSRFMAIWYQGTGLHAQSPQPFGYGRHLNAAMINAALATPEPYKKLSYHPGVFNPDGHAHGTLTTSIAAGGGASGRRGVAPEADLIFVHLAMGEGHPAQNPDPTDNMGDSVRLLEGIDFACKTAGDRPLVINMSLGRHAGSHDGKSLVELAMDHLLSTRKNTMICQTVGNYYDLQAHHEGTVRPGHNSQFSFVVAPGDPTDNEVEIWYSGNDVIQPVLRHPGSGIEVRCTPDNKSEIKVNGNIVGRMYHRTLEPNNGKNNINLFLYTNAPSGRWVMQLEGERVLDGRFHTWIERDDVTGWRAKLDAPYVDRHSTLGTICNGLHTIVVGAVGDPNQISPFSSSGPTADGRLKPDILAPGENIPGAKSALANAKTGSAALRTDSGTSFAGPQVTGTVALMLELARQPVDSVTLRTLLLASAEPLTNLSADDVARAGNGLLKTRLAVEAMRQYQIQPIHHPEFAPQMNPLPSFFENAYQPDSNTSAGRLFLTPSDNGRELPIASGPPQSFSSLDEALQAALRPGRQCSVIRGNLFSGGNFDLIDLVLPVCPITPLVARFRPAISNICCLVLDGYAPYFAASISQPGERWVQFPDTREFYLQPDRIKLTQKKEWADGIVKKLDHISLPGVVFSEPAVRRLSAPEMRLLLTNFAQHIFPVKRVDQVTNRGTFKGGGMEQGLTMPVLPSPLHEPECYPTVISNREGRLEAINAYDGGAGISVGAVQFNVQNGELFKFLGKIWEQDRPLFDDAFSGLGWTMTFRQSNGRSIAVLHVTDPRGTTRLLTGIGSGAGGKDESIRYFHCGDPDRAQRKDIDFRTDMTRRFLKLVVWPHIQYLLHDVSLDSLREAMNLVNRMGVPQLDLVRPDRTIFVLRAVLASAYIRASGCASNLMQKLRSYHTAAEKLEHLAEAIEELENIGSFDCAESLRTRLARQRVTAGEVFGQIQQMLGAAHPAAPAAPAPAAPAPARPPAEAQFAPDDMSNWSEGSVWSEWWDGSNAVDPTCDCHAAISNQELAITDAWDEPFGEAVLNLEDAGFSGSTLWAKWQNE